MPPTIHATAIARDGTAILLVGPPGSGKSDLALRLLDRGWQLVADDRVIATPEAGGLMLSAPATLAGLLEVRGVGILPVEAASPAPARLLVDLAATPDRLPEAESREIAGVALPLLRLNAFEASAPIKIERALAQALAAG